MTSKRVRFDVDEQARQHFMAFVESFLAPELKARWVTLFDAGTSAAWRKIDPWKLWQQTHRVEGRHYEPSSLGALATLQTAAASLPKDTPLCVFHLGHSVPAAHTLRFGDVIQEDMPLEGVVSLVAGHIALVLNHDGDGLLCKR